MPRMVTPIKSGRPPKALKMHRHAQTVVPTDAGTHFSASRASARWIPAFAGMTISLLVFLPASPVTAAEKVSDKQAIQLLDRVGFGPTTADVEHVRTIGIDKFIAEQLDPSSIAETPDLVERLAGFGTLTLSPGQLFVEYGPLRAANGAGPNPDEQKARRQRARVIVQQAQDARVLRALYSRRQLQEVMVDFWFNHFNVFAQKGLDHLWIGSFEEQAIRPNALGHFRDLLLATARHPAMIFYLDNAQNSAPGSKGPGGRDLGLNENYAREVMELHTLGADGGYSQDDVDALARILTGWGLPRPNQKSPDGSGFLFDASRHDIGPKRFLGHDIASAGEAEVIEALDLLARSPATAHHIAFELVQYFVADAPPPALVERVAAKFVETGGDIRATLQTLFASREFRDSFGGKYKTPYRYVLSAARAAGVAVKNPRPLLNAMARQGMPLYGCLTPDGYRDTADKWLSPDATMIRAGFAVALANGNLPVGDDAPQMEAAMQPAAASVTPDATVKHETVDAGALGKLLAPVLSSNTRSVVAEAPEAQRAALLLGGPDFMRR